MHFIFLDLFWVVHIPFVHMVKFKLLALFPVDHLANPAVSSFILFCANLLHPLKWLINLPLSQHNLHRLFCCIWCCFAPLSVVIMFLSSGFLFVALSKSSGVKFRLFVAWNIDTAIFLCRFLVSSHWFFDRYVMCVESGRCYLSLFTLSYIFISVISLSLLFIKLKLKCSYS